MTAQDLWQAYHQILSITFLKEFIKLNVNSDMIIKNAEHVELHKKIATAFFNLIEYKCLCCNKNYQQFDENLKG